MSRVLPTVGAEVRVIDLGAEHRAVIEDVSPDGRTLTVAGERFALHPMTGHWVRVGDPYYGRRLSLAV